MKNIHTFILICAVILLFGCAQQSTPSGGKEDVEPPKIVESSPQNFQLNFSGNEIELKFDEFVQINSLKEQLVVTPSLKFPPQFQLSGKKLKISFIDSLKPNTTYQFNFGEGIKDITEGNPLDSNLFVFSTGSFIDSLSINGIIKDAFTLAPVEKALVMLYESDEDSLPFKERPSYFSRTDKQGKFEVKYLPNREFKLITVLDENLNYLFDPQSEQVGYYENLISPKDTVDYELFLFKEKFSNQYIKSVSSPEYGKVLFEFNEPTKDVNIETIGVSFKKQWFIADMNKTKDSLVYWITEALDSLKFRIVDGEFVDTVDVLMMEKPTEKKWNEKKLSIGVNAKRKGILELFDTLYFRSMHPVEGYDEKKIILVESDKDTIPIKLQSNDVALRIYYFEYKWKEATKYSITVLPGAFIDVFDLQNDTIRTSFESPTWNKYADVKLNIELPEGCEQAIIQLTSSSKVVQENTMKENQEITYSHLTPGKYGVKMIYDDNKNGIWDTGSLLEKKQPERIIYYSGVIEVRSGWDVDLTWKIEN